jgi:hypothetical protein
MSSIEPTERKDLNRHSIQSCQSMQVLPAKKKREREYEREDDVSIEIIIIRRSRAEQGFPDENKRET